MTPELPVIIIDSREQIPYEFEGSQVGTLKSGDYSLDGFQDRVAVERKSKADLYAE